MDMTLAIVSLSSVAWSYLLVFNLYMLLPFIRNYIAFNLPMVGGAITLLIYFAVLLFNLFTVRYCVKARKARQSSKVPVILSIAGTALYLLSIVVILLIVWWVQYTGGV